MEFLPFIVEDSKIGYIHPKYVTGYMHYFVLVFVAVQGRFVSKSHFISVLINSPFNLHMTFGMHA